MRRIAARTRGANPIFAVDVNRYLIGEAAALAKHEGLDRYIDFQTGDAIDLPFESNRFDCTISCTVMEEGDADRPYAPYGAYGGTYGRAHVPPAPYYAPAYRPYAPYGYRSGYAPYASPYAAPYGYYGAPGGAVALHFHGGQSCSRSHVSLHIGW